MADTGVDDADDQSVRDLLTREGLYVGLTVSAGVLLPASISQPCSTCVDEQVTTWTRTKTEGGGLGNRLTYRCAHCNKTSVYFWVLTSSGGEKGAETRTYTKIGQYPAPTVHVPRDVKKSLSSSSFHLYRKALFCLAQGYGIGAAAYLRRVVDESVGELLDLVVTADPENAELRETVAKTKGSKSADERLKLVAPLIPSSLKAGGINPLSVLYEQYSIAIHAQEDEACARDAQELRQIFEYTHVELRHQIKKQREFVQKVRAIKTSK